MINLNLEFLKRDKLLSFSLIIVFIQIFIALFAPILGFQDPYKIVVIEDSKIQIL